MSRFGINVNDLRQFVIRPVLSNLNVAKPNVAEELLLGTAAQESNLGHFLSQKHDGPARGIFQMEPQTFQDIWEEVVELHKERFLPVLLKLGYSGNGEEDLIFNLRFSCAMARLHYWRFAEPFPRKDDIEGLAKYWKKYYNTSKGRGTSAEFVLNYRKMIKSC